MFSRLILLVVYAFFTHLIKELKISGLYCVYKLYSFKKLIFKIKGKK